METENAIIKISELPADVHIGSVVGECNAGVTGFTTSFATADTHPDIEKCLGCALSPFCSATKSPEDQESV